ncbi:MAG: type I methionyl aminopeptidase [Actinomycetota bacterium]
MIIRKTPEQIQAMRRAGRALAEVYKDLEQAVKPGANVLELDKLVERSIRLRGATPSFLGYRGFPASICASVNDVVVHGIPTDRALQEGDIFSADLGLILEGWHADCARTYPVGKIEAETARLLTVTDQSLAAGIEQCRPGNHMTDISHAIQTVVEAAGFSIVREYAGHQIGRQLHEGDIWVSNFGTPGKGPKLQPGMVFAIEPMVNAGGWQTRVLDDGWTVVTEDGSLSAHFEHTVAITAEGPLVLTAA